MKLEQLERLRSEDTPRRLIITHTIESYWIPSQKMTKSKLHRRLMITHTTESYWIPSQKMTKSKLQILKIRQNFKFLNFETGITRDTPSEVAWYMNKKWIRWVLLKIQSGHDSVHRRTDGQTDKVIPVYPPITTSLKRGV